MIHHRGGRGLDEALPLLEPAVEIGDGACRPAPLVLDRIEDEDRLMTWSRR